MTIDEAIEQFKTMAKDARGEIIHGDDLEPQEKYYNSQLESCVEEKEQLAEWLEELKAIKDGSIPIIHGKAELELHDKVIRKEAIGDMVGNLIANSRTEIIDGKLMLIVTEERIKTVANEMKKQLDQLN